jgi:hypothetical protein
MHFHVIVNDHEVRREHSAKKANRIATKHQERNRSVLIVRCNNACQNEKNDKLGGDK